MKRYHSFACVLAALVASACSADVQVSAKTDAERVHEIFRDFEVWEIEQYPSRAAALRGDRSEVGRIADYSLEAFAQRDAALRRFHDRLHAIDCESLSANDRISRDVFEYVLQEQIGAYERGRYLFAIGPMHGIHLVATWYGHFTFEDPDDAANYLRHLSDLPQHIEHVVDRLREGIRAGRTSSLIGIKRVIEQIDELLASDLEPFGWPFGASWERLPEMERQELWARYHRRTLPTLRRAFQNLRRFIVEEYLPHCREEPGLCHQPGGAEFYAQEVAILTTTSFSPNELHEIGLREVARLRELMIEGVRRTDFLERCPEHAGVDDDALLAAFLAWVRDEPSLYHTDGKEILAAWRHVYATVKPLLPHFFRTLPDHELAILERPTMAGAMDAPVEFIPGDPDSGRASAVLVNTARLDLLPRFSVLSMALHEAVPGHHVQIALGWDVPDLPQFRRTLWLPVFGEGWAMYAEELGIEMGLYSDPFDDIGRLHSQMWRACRLVIDTGIHAHGWTRDQAETYLRQHTVLRDSVINYEIERAVAWPGQFTVYTIGRLKFQELRNRAEEALGPRFDIREFHDVILLAGSVPLPVLERRVMEWIEAEAQ
jgi:uncharacterized protein (DUF885 family)